MNKDYVRTSVVAEYIDGLLKEKRALGFSYQFEEYLLNVFDHYCIENSLKDPCFSRQFLEQWLTARDHVPALVGFLCTLLCLVVFGRENFLIPAMLLITLVLTILRRREEGTV